MVEVTQEDRKAVLDFHAKALGLVINGKDANQLLIQSFARHRIAALEEAAQVADDHCYLIDIDEFMSMTKKEHGAYACRSAATAIRALKGQTDDPA